MIGPVYLCAVHGLLFSEIGNAVIRAERKSKIRSSSSAESHLAIAFDPCVSCKQCESVANTDVHRFVNANDSCRESSVSDTVFSVR